MKNTFARCALAAAVLAAAAHADDPAPTQKILEVPELMERFGFDFDNAPMRAEKVAEGLHVLFGIGGNVAVSIGSQGVLIVDDMFAQTVPQLRAAIRDLGGDGIDFAINTHGHFDHADGNRVLGPDGTWIAAHANAAAMLAEDRVINLMIAKTRQRAHPAAARPTLVFEDRMRFHFNGEDIDLIHIAPAHTAGDAVVLFRDRGVVHMGDVFNNAGMPFIDVGSGGSVDGMIAFCRAILEEIGPDAVVIPGHGAIADRARLAAYADMLQTVRDRVAAQIADGRSLDDIEASEPAADFEAAFGAEENSFGFINRVHASLMRDGL